MLNLKYLLQSKNITIKTFAEFLGKTEKTARNKLDGTTEFTYFEAKKVQKMLFPEYNTDYLFSEQNPRAG